MDLDGDAARNIDDAVDLGQRSSVPSSPSKRRIDEADAEPPSKRRGLMVEAWLTFLKRHSETEGEVLVAEEDSESGLAPTETADKHKKPGKGHEIPISQVEEQLQPLVDEAMVKQWQLWVDIGSVRQATRCEEEALTPEDNVLNMRWLLVRPVVIFPHKHFGVRLKGCGRGRGAIWMLQ